MCIQCLNENMVLPSCKKENNGLLEIVDENNNSLYVKCSSKCEKCETSYDNCTQCSLGQFRNSNLPSCSCLDGYHDQNGTT